MSAQQVAEKRDPVWEDVKPVLVTVCAAVVAVALTPLVVPVVGWRVLNDRIATRWRYWLVYPWHWVVNTAGVVLVAMLVLGEAFLILGATNEGEVARLLARPDWAGEAALILAPWVLVNLAAGVLLLPVTYSIHRRRLARRVSLRLIANVVRQEQIEHARKVAADATTAHLIGVSVNRTTGEIVGVNARKVQHAPFLVAGGLYAVGIVNRPTVRNVVERFQDVRRVRSWIDREGRWFVLPGHAAAQRAIILAESGAGKTVFIFNLILAAISQGEKVVFIDGKGDPGDARRLAELVRSHGGSAAVQPVWDFFNGDAEQVTEKLMRLLPPPDGANQHYLNQARLVLQIVQRDSPIRSVGELKARLLNPVTVVRDQGELGIVKSPVGPGGRETLARSVLLDLLAGINPHERHIGSDGWAYTALPADVTIISLTPTIDSEARYGDLLLADLSHYLVHRNQAGDRSPMLTIVDEFPQLVTDGTDPSDKAATLNETARSTGMGLVLASQTTAGLSRDETSRKRLLESGAAIIVGRLKVPEDAVKYAGTTIRMEASGAATTDELRSGRSQHAFALEPNAVRNAADAQMWIIQGGAVGSFRVLPTGEGDRRSGGEVDVPISSSRTEAVAEVGPPSVTSPSTLDL